VALGAGVGLGLAVGVGEGAADGEAAATSAEGCVTGLVDGDASWFELQPAINPTIPNTATTVESFMSFIAPCPCAWPVQLPKPAVRRAWRASRDPARG
jgi:hypothetical protein